MNSLTIRKWHGYLGMFIAPSVLFFALTGSVQLFSLHEAHGNYQPPPILEKLGKLHKDQVFEQKNPSTPDTDHDASPASTANIGAAASVGAGAPSDAAPGGEKHEHQHEHKTPRVSVYVLKWFFLMVALGLTISTAFGIWMGLKQALRRRTHVVLLIVGAVVPIILTVI